MTRHSEEKKSDIVVFWVRRDTACSDCGEELLSPRGGSGTAKSGRGMCRRRGENGRPSASARRSIERVGTSNTSRSSYARSGSATPAVRPASPKS